MSKIRRGAFGQERVCQGFATSQMQGVRAQFYPKSQAWICDEGYDFGRDFVFVEHVNERDCGSHMLEARMKLFARYRINGDITDFTPISGTQTVGLN